MKTICVWRENADYSRTVSDWLNDFERRTDKVIESLSPDSIEGENFVRIYDIVEYPTIIAIDDMGRELSTWRGLPLPLIDEVSYYSEEKPSQSPENMI